MKDGKLHPNDVNYFKDYPAPFFQSMVEQSPVEINATTPHYGILLYSLIKALQSFNVVEIGLGYGWCSWFMATAVKENVSRYRYPGRYLGIDISTRTKDMFDDLIKQNYPIKYIYKNSIDVKTEDLLLDNGGKVDVLFQDGNHDTNHCFKELEIIYPALKDNGNGYLICHDTSAWCEDYYNKLIKDTRYKFEYVSFVQNFGLTIFRRIDGYEKKLDWPVTAEKHASGYL